LIRTVRERPCHQRVAIRRAACDAGDSDCGTRGGGEEEEAGPSGSGEAEGSENEDALFQRVGLSIVPAVLHLRAMNVGWLDEHKVPSVALATDTATPNSQHVRRTKAV
jgi:hypothetical protein